MRSFRYVLVALTLTCFWTERAHSQGTGSGAVTNQSVANAQTVAYCDLFEHPDKFEDKVVRVQAIHETDFEKSVIMSPACPLSFPLMIWVEFDDGWEHRTKRKVRKKVSHLNWRVPLDVVFIGKIKTDGKYGHMDMYPLEIEVYKVEAATTPKGAETSPKS